MTHLSCGGCGRALLTTAAHAGLTLSCDACGGRVHVPPAPASASDEDSVEMSPAEPRRRPPTAAASDPRPAMSGDVPVPMASGADSGASNVLALAAASLVIPLLGPIALWLAISSRRRIAERGGEEPASIRHARFIATVGTVLLGVLIVCAIPFLLVLG